MQNPYPLNPSNPFIPSNTSNPLNPLKSSNTSNTSNTSNPPPQPNPSILFYIDKGKIKEGTTTVQFYKDDNFQNPIQKGTVISTPFLGLGFGKYTIESNGATFKVKNVYTYELVLSDNGKQVQVGVGGRRRKSKKVFKNMNKNKNKNKNKKRKSRKSSTRSRRY